MKICVRQSCAHSQSRTNPNAANDMHRTCLAPSVCVMKVYDPSEGQHTLTKRGGISWGGTVFQERAML